jgi:hypothetical protein
MSFQPVYPERFGTGPAAKFLFAAAEQQFSSFQPLGTIAVKTPQGWAGYQWEYRFAKGYPVTEQPLTAIPEPKAFPPPNGWYGTQYDYRFATPFPVKEQQYTAGPWKAPVGASPPPSIGWFSVPFLEYRYAKPFPVWEQQYHSFPADMLVPPVILAGAGKRRDFPSYIPQPPYEAKKNPPFRPVWDKPKGGTIEQPKPAAPLAVAPPPQDIFGAPAQAAPQLPSFDHLVPHDPMGLSQRLRQAREMTDVADALRALGIFGGDA